MPDSKNPGPGQGADGNAKAMFSEELGRTNLGMGLGGVLNQELRGREQIRRQRDSEELRDFTAQNRRKVWLILLALLYMSGYAAAVFLLIKGHMQSVPESSPWLMIALVTNLSVNIIGLAHFIANISHGRPASHGIQAPLNASQSPHGVLAEENLP